ncbi:hypothetical protein M9Y10_035243 [Tritrichomonas musculus]|uniref:Man1/Src1 C-terminal domain-containing protein n=1 Tax=Tritrichomonas musculus TaxID=1915356 RepID=A0ABR2KH77_9EUKA
MSNRIKTETPPLNPFLRKTKQERRQNRLQLITPVQKSRSPTPTKSIKNKNSYSFCNLASFITISLIICLSIFFYLSFIYDNSLIFCEGDEITQKCRPCPRNGKCLNGKLSCDKGYSLKGGVCIANNGKYGSQDIRLFTKMCKFIASSLQKNCEGRIITFTNLSHIFANEKSYSNSIILLENYGYDSEYRILYLRPDSFRSQNPILSNKCKVQMIFNENRYILLLFTITIFLSLLLLAIIAYNQRTSKQIRECSNEVVRNIKRSQKGEFKNSSDFSLSDSNPMSKFWDKIVDEVERNPSVTVLNTSKGKLWGYT